MDLYAMNMDHCPESDAVIDRGTCTGCPYYKGFQMENGLPCIKCTYYSQSDKSQDSE